MVGVFAWLILGVTGLLIACSVVIERQRRKRPDPTPRPEPSPWEKEGGADLTMPSGGPAALAPLPAGARLRQHSTRRPSNRLLRDVAAGLERIPPFPNALLQILRELDAAGSSARSVAEIVSTEPILTAALLRVANSASCGVERDVVTVADAVAFLGFSTVRTLICRLKLGVLFAAPTGATGYDAERLWVHSMAVAQVAEELATRAGGTDPRLALTAGLLHDIGKVAINSQFPEALRDLRKRNGPPGESFLARERRLFGADHAFIGAHLAANWKLPEELVGMVRLHHLPAEERIDLPREARRALLAGFCANQLVKYCQVYCEDMEIDIIPGWVMNELGLPTQTDALLDGTVRQIIDRAAMLGAAATLGAGHTGQPAAKSPRRSKARKKKKAVAATAASSLGSTPAA